MNTQENKYGILYIRLAKAELDELRASARADMRTVASLARLLIVEGLKAKRGKRSARSAESRAIQAPEEA